MVYLGRDKNKPLSGNNLSRVLNLKKNRFPSFSPWKYKNDKNELTKHHFNEHYYITVGQVHLSTSKTLLGIDFLKVRFDDYYLTVFNFRNNMYSPFVKLKKISQIKNFDHFKERIQSSFKLDSIIKRIRNMREFDDYHSHFDIYQGDVIETSNCFQKLIKDVKYFQFIIYDSRNNYFKLRHLHHLLPKLLEAYSNIQSLNCSSRKVYMCKFSESSIPR